MSSLRFGVTCVLLFFGGLPMSVAQDSNTLPEIYKHKLSKYVTSSKVLLAQPIADELIKDEDVLTISYQKVEYVTEDNKHYKLIHRMVKPLTKVGVDYTKKDSISFGNRTERLHVIFARTHGAEGVIHDVPTDGRIRKTPQNQSRSDIYSDDEELILAFPAVEIGCVVEYLVLVEVFAPYVKNHFSTTVFMDPYYPALVKNHIIDLPASYGKRLSQFKLGEFVTDGRVEPSEPGRFVCHWQQKNIRGTHFEYSRAPINQVGPCLKLTTFSGWGEYAHWYQEVLKPVSVLTPEIKKAVDDWTKGMTDPKEIGQAILSRIANDFEYIGLEFGMGGYQPYACHEIWKNKFGDCKDKANLMRMALQYKGIESYIVLLQTKHAGHFNTKYPLIHQFNHAIVALSLDGTELVFCDPTMPNAKLDELPDYDSGRPAFLVNDKKHKLVDIPAVNEGQVSILIDATMAQDGEISGWCSFEISKYLAASWTDFYASKDRPDTRESVIHMTRLFLPDAEIVDYELSPTDETKSHFAMKIYFISKAPKADFKELPVGIREGGFFIRDLQDIETRNTPYFQGHQATKITYQIKLPDGWSPKHLPRSYSLNITPVKMSGVWTFKEGVLKASMSSEDMQALVLPSDWAVYRQGMSSIRTWCNQVVFVLPNAQAGTQSQQTTLPNIDMPLMPTATGQFDFIDRKYVLGEKNKQRKQALEQLIQWFPQKQDQVFQARIELALILQDDGKVGEAIEAMQTDVSRFGHSVSSSYALWAEYMIAKAYHAKGENEVAYSRLNKIVAHAKASQFRKSWSYYSMGLASLPKNVKQALAAFYAGVEVGGDALDLNVEEFLFLAMKEAAHSDLLKMFSLIQKSNNHKILADAISTFFKSKRSEGDTESIGMLLSLLEKAEVKQAIIAEDETLLKKINNFMITARQYEDVVNHLKLKVQKEKPSWWDTIDTPNADTKKDLLAHSVELRKKKNFKAFVKVQTQYLTDFPIEVDTFGYQLWLIPVYLEGTDLEEELLEYYLDVLDQLPPSDDYFYEGKILRCNYLLDAKDIKGAKFAADSGVDASLSAGNTTYAAVLPYYQGKVAEAAGSPEIALQYYQKAEDKRSDNTYAYDAVFKAMMIHLFQGEYEKAYDKASLFKEEGAKDIAPDLHNGQEIGRVMAMIDNKKTCVDFWRSQDQWRKDWSSLVQAMEGVALSGESAQSLFSNENNLYDRMYAHYTQREPAKHFQVLQEIVLNGRWFPDFRIMALEGINSLRELLPSKENVILKAGVALAQNFPTNNQEYVKTARAYEITFLLDLKKYTNVITSSNKYFAKYQDFDALSEEIAHLQARAAIILENTFMCKMALMRLYGFLGASAPDLNRAVTVYWASVLHRALGDTDKEQALLTRELGRADIKQSEHFKLLNSRLEGLKSIVGKGSYLTEVVQDFLSKHKPGWYDYANPKALDEVENLDILLKRELEGLPHPEKIKTFFLLALDESREIGTRYYAFRGAISYLIESGRHFSNARKYLFPLIDNKNFDQYQRGQLLWVYYYQTKRAGFKELDKRLIDETLLSSLDAEQASHVRLARYYRGFGRSPASTYETHLNQLMNTRITTQKHELIVTLFVALVRTGTPDAIDRILNKAKDVKFDSEADLSPFKFRIGLQKIASAQKAYYPMRNAMIRFIEKYSARPALAFDDLLLDFRPKLLVLYQTKEESVDLMRHWVLHGLMNPKIAWLWSSSLYHVLEEKNDLATKESAVRLLFDTAPTDRDRFSALEIAHSLLDEDVKEDRDLMRRLFQEYTDVEKSPQFSERAKIFEWEYDLIEGLYAPVDSLKRVNGSGYLKNEAQWLSFRVAFDRFDKAAMSRHLDSLSPQEWLVPDHIYRIVRALKILNRTDELALLNEEMEALLYKNVLLSWCYEDTLHTDKAIRYIQALGEKASYPPKWREHILKVAKDPEARDHLMFEFGLIDKNYAEALKGLNALLEHSPTSVDYIWYKAFCYDKLGQAKEAVIWAEKYLTMRPIDVYSPEAKEMLNRLKGETGNTKR